MTRPSPRDAPVTSTTCPSSARTTASIGRKCSACRTPHPYIARRAGLERENRDSASATAAASAASSPHAPSRAVRVSSMMTDADRGRFPPGALS
jgi:hypothetical protein